VGSRLGDFPKGYVRDVELLTGWGVLLPVSVSHDVGLYNDRHFKQCGDTELPVRAKHQGYRLVVSYSAPIGVYAGMTADINAASKYRLADLRNYFFSVKPNFRLTYRFSSQSTPPPIRSSSSHSSYQMSPD
jgi:GT2 family glycosyltransferase